MTENVTVLLIYHICEITHSVPDSLNTAFNLHPIVHTQKEASLSYEVSMRRKREDINNDNLAFLLNPSGPERKRQTTRPCLSMG